MELEEFTDCSPTTLNRIKKIIKSYLPDFIDITKSEIGNKDERLIFLNNKKVKDFIIENHLLEVFKHPDNKLLTQTVAKLKSNEGLFANQEFEIVKGIIDIIKSNIIKNTFDNENDQNSLLDLYGTPINQYFAYGHVDHSNSKTLLYDLIIAKNSKKICKIETFKNSLMYFILPVNIYNYNGNIYIDTFAIDGRDIHDNKIIMRHEPKERTFAVHRLNKVEILDFKLPKKLLTKQIEKPNAFGFMHGKETFIINVNFKKIMHNFIFERKWPGIIKGYPVIIKNGFYKDEIKLKMYGNNIDEVCYWLLGFGPNVAVIGDLNLRKRYRKLLNRTLYKLKKQITEAKDQKKKNDKKTEKKEETIR
jgi:hypothetical protein